MRFLTATWVNSSLCLNSNALIFRKNAKSPFDVPGIKTKAKTKDIFNAVKEYRERFTEQDV